MAKADRRAVITSKMGSNEVEAEAESQNTNTRKVAYIWSQEYEQVSDCLPSNIGRVAAPQSPFLTHISPLEFTL